MGFQKWKNQKAVQPNSDVDVDNVGDNLFLKQPALILPTPPGILSDETTYASWLVEHPSALDSFDSMMKSARGRKIVVFLDYDGTLSPIVDDPDKAFMSDEMRSVVREVGKYFSTAVISGRSREKVKEFVKLSNVYYAGSHGMDIMAPARPVKSSDGTVVRTKTNEVLFQPAHKFLPEIQKILAELEQVTSEIQGSRLEDNRFCITVHYRQVQEQDYAKLEAMVKSVLQKYSGFRLCQGNMVLEVRPSIEWNKGHALEYFLDTLGLGCSKDILPIYIGDDRTDEDAFKVIENRGQGFSVIVSSVPKETGACYSLQDPSEVGAFLFRLARWRKDSFSGRTVLGLSGFAPK